MVAKGKAPNLRNSSYLYRDENSEIVWRACCLMVTYEAEFQNIYSAAEWEGVKKDFMRGARDSDFIHVCKVMDKSFLLTDLRFVQLASCESATDTPMGTEGLDQAQVVALRAEFNLCHETLRTEQAARPLDFASQRLPN